jgi:hypothetical protein
VARPERPSGFRLSGIRLHPFLGNFCMIAAYPPDINATAGNCAGYSTGKFVPTWEVAGFWERASRDRCRGKTLGTWIRSPSNPRGSDLAGATDHKQATPSGGQASRIPSAGVRTRLQPRSIRLPGEPRPANSSPREPRRWRGTPHSQDDYSCDLRRKSGPVGAT